MLIDVTDRDPQTRSSVAADLSTLGLCRGDVVLVHSSLRSLGWVCGGAVAVVQALLDVLGPDGTLVVPAQTANNRDPARLTDPPLPERWWPVFREHFPGFDAATTPSEGVGIVAERVRTWPAAVRSAHPQTSFAAVGRQAAWLMAGHELGCHLGERSPLARLAAVDAKVLLLGVDFRRATAFHLAEYRQPNPPVREYACAVMTPQGRRWITYDDVDLDDSDFGALGAAFERDTVVVRAGRVGRAVSRFFPLADAVGYAERWMRANRPASGGVRAERAEGAEQGQKVVP